MRQLIPILLYHGVPERAPDDSFAVASARFASHVEAIAATGRCAMTISEIADGLSGRRRLPDRVLAVTFDDGFDDTVAAVKLLADHELRSTVYLTTGSIGERDAISAEQVQTLARWEGTVELGSHTITHPYLDELSLAAAEHEIASSKRDLEQVTGREVSTFAYPHGAYDASVRDLVIASGYRSAAAVKNALSYDGDDPWAIARWTVRCTTTADDVAAFLAGCGTHLAWRRERLRTRAYRELRRTRRRLRRAPEPPRRARATRAPAPLASVVVPTCANDAAAVRCVTAIRDRARGPLEVIVVENRPARSNVSDALTRTFGPGAEVSYVEEARPGLARARNAGLAAARAGIVAFVDDDVVVGEDWFDALRKAFAAHPGAACVTGRIDAVELETRAQSLLEQFATYGKGLQPRVYSIKAPPADVPLFPYTAGHFGSGANMAFSREALVALGGFDPFLGTGTSSRGGEDLDICIRLLLAGHTLVYEPRAVVFHQHPDTMRMLDRQVFNYGWGLGALIAKHLITGSDRSALVRQIPDAVRYLLDRESRKNAGKGSDFPARLDALELLGLLAGPIGYLCSRSQAYRPPSPWPRRSAAAPHRPVWSGELDLAHPVIAGGPRLTESGVAFDQARLLIRVLGEPVGFVRVPLSLGELELSRVLAAVDAALAGKVDRILSASSLPLIAELIARDVGGVTGAG